MDGFRFDLASALCRDPQGQPMAAPPLIRELAKDPVLSKVHFHAPLCNASDGETRRELSARLHALYSCKRVDLPLSITGSCQYRHNHDCLLRCCDPRHQ